MKQFLTRKQVAARLQICLNTLDKFVEEGTLKSVVLQKGEPGKNGRKAREIRRFREEDLENIGYTPQPIFHTRKKRGA